MHTLGHKKTYHHQASELIYFRMKNVSKLDLNFIFFWLDRV